MQRGFLGGTKDKQPRNNDVSERVAGIRHQLKEAELELRSRRQRRLQVEENLREATNPVVKDAGYPQVACHVPALELKAITALASHAEPPAAPIYRLAESLMLLFKARILIELREHVLPSQIPWSNLQALLRKPRGAKDSNDAIVAALGQNQFGHRIATHVRERLTVAPPLTQEVVAAVDGRCVCILDWINAVLSVAEATRKYAEKEKASKPDVAVDISSFEEERDRAAVAVTSQEQEVVRLRKLVVEAENSDAAALAFAAEHAPKSATNGFSTSDVSTLSIAAKQDKIAAQEHFVSSVADDRSTQLVVASTKTLQYRLNEIMVPELQEPVLLQLAQAVTEARSGGKRCLNVRSIAEDREEPGTGVKRAEKVLEWLIEHGVRADQVSVDDVEQSSARGSRRVEVQILHGECADDFVRKRAGDLLDRVLHPETYHEKCALQDDAMEVDESAASLTSGFANLRVSGADGAADLEGMD